MQQIDITNVPQSYSLIIRSGHVDMVMLGAIVCARLYMYNTSMSNHDFMDNMMNECVHLFKTN